MFPSLGALLRVNPKTIYRLPPLPPTPNNFDELMFGRIDDEESWLNGILVKGPSWEPIERGLEIQEAWKLRNLESRGLEARRLGGGSGSVTTPSQEPIERGLETRRPGS